MNPFKQRVLNGQLNAATWIPNGTLMFRAWEMRAGDSERGTTRGWEEGGVGVWCCHCPLNPLAIWGTLLKEVSENDWNEKEISFCIAYALQIRLHILLDYGMLQSHFSHEVYALQTSAPCPGEETFFSRAGKAMVCHAGCHAGFGSSERLYQLISTDQGRGKEKNLSLKSAAPNENQHSCSLQWHMIAHQWLSVRRCLRNTRCFWSWAYSLLLRSWFCDTCVLLFLKCQSSWIPAGGKSHIFTTKPLFF